MSKEVKQKKRATLRDIAGIAGVSLPTASLVLSGKGPASRISAEVERRVRQIALENDYTPNLLVRSMQKGRTDVISFYSSFHGDPRERGQYNAYMDRMISATLRAAAVFGYDLLTYCRTSQSAEQVYQSLNGRQADGVLFFGPHENDPLLALLRRSRLPTVMLNHIDERGELSYVSDDVAAGMKLVAEAMLTSGHRRIGAIGTLLPGADAPMRIALLRDYLRLGGGGLSDECITHAGPTAGRTSQEALQQLMALPEPPTAIFCWNDALGYDVLEACEELGIAVPEQLSIVGYDGVFWINDTRHKLASVVVDMDLLVETATGFLDRLIQGESSPLHAVLPASFAPGSTLGRRR